VLALALAVALYQAISPHHVAVSIPRDDLEHALWAYGLTALGIAAFPQTRAVFIGAVLIASSGVAELLQPLVGRGAELSDWASSAAGVAAAMAPLVAVASRTMHRSSGVRD
jgi:VanZ family protein